MKSFFQNLNLFSKFWLKTEKIFKRIARHKYWSNYNVYIIYQWICLDKLYKQMQSFFQNSNLFLNWCQTTENIQMNREAWILIKVQCVIYQWILLDKLYKRMGRYFQISNLFLFFELLAKNRKIFEWIGRLQYWSKCNVLYIDVLQCVCTLIYISMN